MSSLDRSIFYYTRDRRVLADVEVHDDGTVGIQTHLRRGSVGENEEKTKKQVYNTE